MKFPAVIFLSLVLCGCTTLFTPAQTTAVKQAVSDPNNIGKATQAGVQLAASLYLGKNNNATTTGDYAAAADVLTALAATNPNAITGADISSALTTAKVATSTATQIASDAEAALSLFETSFSITFPTLKPNYAIYLLAVANGLNGALGKAQVPLPVIPWPPVTPTAKLPGQAPIERIGVRREPVPIA